MARSEVRFVPLNPARGDASPKAGVLWGDLRKDVPTGAIIQFASGFSSPPHIHNVTYRGVVIEGALHNDDPDAAKHWMGPGSFWTQPAGESHITAAAESGKAVAFLEILEGPYLVKPPGEAFDNGERPVNVDARNVVWLDADDVTWIDANGTEEAEGSAMAFLWKGPQDSAPNGSFLKLQPGFRGTLRSAGGSLRAVVIQGRLDHRRSGDATGQGLGPGSYFGSSHGGEHDLTCAGEAECLVYVSADGKYGLEQRP